jgi:hypothetical protein
MTWRNRVFDEERQIGFGEFTFSYGSQVHGAERRAISRSPPPARATRRSSP